MTKRKSLSSGLPARKRGAKPAVRAQLQVLSMSTTLVSAPVAREVVRQHKQVAAPNAASAGHFTVPRRSALIEGRRAAFRPRIDEDRHVLLRQACGSTGRSAQQLLIDALDCLFSNLPDHASPDTQADNHADSIQVSARGHQ